MCWRFRNWLFWSSASGRSVLICPKSRDAGQDFSINSSLDSGMCNVFGEFILSVSGVRMSSLAQDKADTPWLFGQSQLFRFQRLHSENLLGKFVCFKASIIRIAFVPGIILDFHKQWFRQLETLSMCNGFIITVCLRSGKNAFRRLRHLEMISILRFDLSFLFNKSMRVQVWHFSGKPLSLENNFPWSRLLINGWKHWMSLAMITLRGSSRTTRGSHWCKSHFARVR